MAEAAIGALAVRIVGDVSDFVQKFDRADKAVEKFSKKLDTRLLQPLAKVSAAAGAAAAGIFLFTKRASDMVDELGKLSQKVGVSVESLSALKHAAALSDVSLEQLGTGLRQLAKNMADTQANTGEAKDAFQALGMSVVDAQGRLKGTEQQLLEIAERFSKMDDGAGKTALAMRIFGRAGADLIPLLNEGKAGLEAMRKEAERLGIVFSGDAARSAQEFNDNISRLQGAVDGLQVKLAGPLVEALNKAAQAALQANERHESFFRTIIEGFRTLVTGDDLHKWNVEMAEAGDSLLKAQNKLDQAMRVQQAPGMREWGDRLVKEAKSAVDRAQAEIARLQSIKPILAPDPAKPSGGAGGAAAPSMQDDAQVKARAALAAKLLEIDRKMREAAAEEAQIKYGEWIAGEAMADETAEALRAERLKALQEYLASERQLRREAVADEIQLAQEKANREWQLQQESQRKQVEARRQFVDNLAGLMNTSSKKAFEFGKKVSIAQAAVKGAQAIMDAWQAGMSVGGPWAPAVAAAYAGAAAINAANIIGNIRSQEFGGGGGTPIAPSQGSSGVSPVGAGGAGGNASAGGGQTVIVNMPGEDMMSTKNVRALVEKLNESLRDGGKIVLQ